MIFAGGGERDVVVAEKAHEAHKCCRSANGIVAAVFAVMWKGKRQVKGYNCADTVFTSIIYLLYNKAELLTCDCS